MKATEQVSKKSQNQVIEQMRIKAATVPHFNAVFHLFAARERARAQVTLSTLRLSMAQEGFKFTDEQYSEVLQFLASLGIGRLDMDSKNRVRALKDIKVTLQSVGQAAVGKQASLAKFSVANSYTDLPKQEIKAAAPAPIKQAPAKVEFTSSLVVYVDGKPVIEFPQNLTPKELGDLLVGMKR